jgi:homoserine dehydrogenase
MPHLDLALLGFGNVGQALTRLLLRKRADLLNQYQITFKVTGIATGRHGAAINPDGLDLERALALIDHKETLNTLATVPPPTDAFDFIRRCSAGVLFENTPVDYESGQPAADHLRLALEQGMYAITANKGPVVHAYRQLTELANSKGRKFYFESSVMDGAPIFSIFREALPAAKLRSFRGILNSTTNLILTRMEGGEPFDQAVAYAQSIGLTETDPSGDIDGWDAAVKVAALATVLMDIPLKPSEVDRQGIRGLNPEDIANAVSQGKRWKLICSARRQGDSVLARVAPEMVPVSSPLYSVEGSSSIVQFETDVLSELSIVEGNPGSDTTAYGLLADFVNAVKDSD